MITFVLIGQQLPTSSFSFYSLSELFSSSLFLRLSPSSQEPFYTLKLAVSFYPRQSRTPATG